MTLRHALLIAAVVAAGAAGSSARANDGAQTARDHAHGIQTLSGPGSRNGIQSTARPAENETAVKSGGDGGVTTGAISAEAAGVATAPPSSIVSEARSRLQNVAQSQDEKVREDEAALAAFYDARGGNALWVTEDGLNDKARRLIGELKNADSYALDAKDFEIPGVPEGNNISLTTDAATDAELALSRAALKYARFARGGRIEQPSEQLNSNLDRRPQWIDPKNIIEQLAASDTPDEVLRSLQPEHEQFRRLREIYVQELAKGKGLTRLAKRVRTNMEMWRWMWINMGDVYVLNNIPEFTQYVYKDGKVIRKAKIVAGEIGKQSSIFSRPLKYVVLRPKWKVPESIKVKEIWPSLIRGGGYMRQYGLQLETKDGQALDWRKFDWTKTDIRKYEVVQPPGGKSVLGHVKFSFPSQHTIFMHDTPDKWMFRKSVRTLSHGCLRVERPMELAELVLKEDKGWDKSKIDELDRSGPLNNAVKITKEIPIHLTYFTVWVDDGGKVRQFSDIYGHEKRITQALDGEWDRINKGRNHLAPVQPINTEAVAAKTNRTRGGAAKPANSVVDILNNALGIN